MVEQIKCTHLPSFPIILVLHFQEKIHSSLIVNVLQLPNSNFQGIKRMWIMDCNKQCEKVQIMAVLTALPKPCSSPVCEERHK